ncbi:MAG: selenocysteine-specific translation elongation factor, partial [Thermomicrobiales bacterium]|nr:selenocysteine-specific translation elongation factor [Thermomicrobiales bacterium]
LLKSLTEQISKDLGSFHASQPLRPGLAREEARRRLGITQPRLFDDLIATVASTGELIDDGATLRLPEFRMSLDPARRAAADQYLAAIRAQPYTPPGPHEHGLDPETLAALEHLAEVTKVADGVYFAPEAWDALVQGTLGFIDSNGSMTLSQFRDHFGTSRKYAQAVLEYLDQLKYTRRVGDDRVRGPRQPGAA